MKDVLVISLRCEKCGTFLLTREVFTLFSYKKGKVYNGQEPPSGESTTIECGVNYQLLAAIY